MADTVLTELKMHVFDTAEQLSQYESEIGDNDLVFNLDDEVDYVVESQLPTSDNNYTWYRKYKSGWLEMGGKLTGRSVTFPVAFALPPTLTMSTGSNDAAATNQNTYSTLTTTGFTGWQTGTNAGWHSGATNFNGYWHACGTAEQ